MNSSARRRVNWQRSVGVRVGSTNLILTPCIQTLVFVCVCGSGAALGQKGTSICRANPPSFDLTIFHSLASEAQREEVVEPPSASPMHARASPPPKYLKEGKGLRGPVAILFISRDTCSDSIAKLVRACFCGVSDNYRAICCKMRYRTDVPVWN